MALVELQLIRQVLQVLNMQPSNKTTKCVMSVPTNLHNQIMIERPGHGHVHERIDDKRLRVLRPIHSLLSVDLRIELHRIQIRLMTTIQIFVLIVHKHDLMILIQKSSLGIVELISVKLQN